MAQNASLWIEGTDLRYKDAGGQEYRIEGDYISSPAGADPGSVWIEGNNIRYIDANGDEREIGNYHIKSVTGTEGSVWIENNRIRYLIGSDEREIHDDTHDNIAHDDDAHSDDHIDKPFDNDHNNFENTNYHKDGFDDAHTDNGFFEYDNHHDVEWWGCNYSPSHSDNHCDTRSGGDFIDHSDDAFCDGSGAFNNHTDNGFFEYDNNFGNRYETWHNDSFGNTSCFVNHQDDHDDIPHDDDAHQDDHDDEPTTV